MLAVITNFILSIGSEDIPAALKNLAIGPADVLIVYNIDYGAIHEIGNDVLARLNLPISSYLPID